jgi:hypothetical protein
MLFDESVHPQCRGYAPSMVGLILAVIALALFVAAEMSTRDRQSRALVITGATALLVGSIWSALSEGQWWAPPAGLVVAGLWILIDKWRDHRATVPSQQEAAP